MRNHISRFYVLTGLLALAFGSALGLRMAMAVSGILSYDSWPSLLKLHQLLQVHGFVVVYTLGVALAVLPRFLNVPLACPQVAVASLVGLITSIALQASTDFLRTARALEFLSVFGFLVVLRLTRKGVNVGEIPPEERRLNRLHAAFMASGVLWLLLALVTTTDTVTADLILWGFASTYVAGIGLRTHPQMLELKVYSFRALLASVLIWNFGLFLELFGQPSGRLFAALGAALYLIGLHPFRRPAQPSAEPPWLRFFLLSSYGWLGLSVLATAALVADQNSAFGASARHLLGSGFLLTMMTGMGLRILPVFEKRPLVWSQAPWAILWALILGNAFRVAYHLFLLPLFFGIGTSLQVLAAILFSVILGLSLLRKPCSSAPTRPAWLHL